MFFMTLSSYVCHMLRAGPTGTEILKNLVLPGVSSFVVVDGNMVTKRDLRNNFFVDEASLGQPRSKVQFVVEIV